MIKAGKNLYATFADGEWFVYQAANEWQFVRICCAAQKKSGYIVPPNGKHWYYPEGYWDESSKCWRYLRNGEFWRKSIPSDKRHR